MKALLPLIALMAACSTEPTPAFEPLADPPVASLEVAPDVESYTTPALTADSLSEPGFGSLEPDATSAEAPGALMSTGPDDPVEGVTVQDGESLALLAEWSGVTAEEIASLNDIDVNDALYPGQELLFPADASAAVTSERTAFTAVRLSRYLDRRGGLAGMRTYRVQTGDTAWSIARQELGVPTWILAHYNAEVSLERLTIGQELLAPVLGDEAAADLGELSAPE